MILSLYPLDLVRSLHLVRTLDALHADEYAANNAAGRAMSLGEAVAFAQDVAAALRLAGPPPLADSDRPGSA